MCMGKNYTHCHSNGTVKKLFIAKTTLVSHQDIFQWSTTEQEESAVEHNVEYDYVP